MKMTRTVIRDIFLKWMLNTLKDFIIFIDLQFLPERMKINKCNKPVCNFYDKT